MLGEAQQDTELAQRLEQLQFAFVISDCREPDCPITYASKAFHDMTGYTPAEVLGKNCRFLQGADTSRQKVSTSLCAARGLSA
jgi:phototropin